MAANLIRLVALSTLAVLASSYVPGAAAANLESHNFVRHEHAARHHGLLVKRQATPTPRRRCRARSTEPTSAAATSAATSPPVATTSVHAPVVTPPAPAWGGGKVGIAFNDGVDILKFIAGSSKVGFVYNWSPFVPEWAGQLPGGVQYVPMLWGQKHGENLRGGLRPGAQKFVLGMNEPNQGDQASIGPGYAAQLWRQYLLPLKSEGYTLVSPAPTNAPNGLTWLQEFHNVCQDCSIDAIALHWYGVSLENFISHVQSYHSAFGKQLWVTEFACQNFGGGAQCSDDQIWAFMDGATRFLDGASYVTMYAYFGVLRDMGNVNWSNQLVNPDSTPNALGRKYLGLA